MNLKRTKGDATAIDNAPQCRLHWPALICSVPARAMPGLCDKVTTSTTTTFQFVVLCMETNARHLAVQGSRCLHSVQSCRCVLECLDSFREWHDNSASPLIQTHGARDASLLGRSSLVNKKVALNQSLPVSVHVPRLQMFMLMCVYDFSRAGL